MAMLMSVVCSADKSTVLVHGPTASSSCVDVSGHDTNEGHVEGPGLCYKQGTRAVIVHIVHAVVE